MTWLWLLFLSAMDIALITAAVIIGGDFHLFSYVAYYPALALFAVVFPHLWLSLAWATMAGAIYAVVSLMVGPGLDFDAGQENWTLRILSGISEGICNTMVQSGGEFLYIGVGGR